MPSNKEDPAQSLLHNPADASKEHVTWVESLRNAPGVRWGLHYMDKDLIPSHPGDLVLIMGRPGHGKTSLLAYAARQEAMSIIARGKQQTEAVVYASLEQVTEEVDSMFYTDSAYTATDVVKGNAPKKAVEANAAKRVHLPIWLMGESISRTTVHTPQMTMDVIFRLVETMYDKWRVKPTLLCIDYLQLIPVLNAKDLMMEVAHASGQMKELAKRCKCPIYLGSQARQEVDDYRMPIPKARDSQWSSRAFQAADKVFAVYRPVMYGKTDFTCGGIKFPVTNRLMAIRKLKERFNHSRFTKALFFDPAKLTMAEATNELPPF